MDKKSIGVRLKHLRKNANLSQCELANYLSMSQPSLNRYENGHSYPSIEVAVRYAEYFDVSLDYLCCRTNNPKDTLLKGDSSFVAQAIEKNDEIKDFIDMCFDPNSIASEKLKSYLYILMTQGGEFE